jgi:integrase
MTEPLQSQGFHNSTSQPTASTEVKDSQVRDIFADFEPPATADGSYRGTMAKVKATELRYQEVFDEKLKDAIANLKRDKTRVSIKQTGNSLQLQATLPLKPGDICRNGRGKKQYLISLGIPANLDGLKTAIEESYELGKLIARHTFEWNEKYLGVKSKEKVEIKTIGELLDKFEDEYFKKNSFTEKRQRMLQKYRIARIKRHCNLQLEVNYDNFRTCINEVSSEGAKDGVLIALKLLSNTFNLQFDFSDIKVNRNRKIRIIPTDEQIEANFLLFEQRSLNRKKQPKSELRNTWKLKAWCYGMLAVYGLRPHELLTHPDIDWWLSLENVDNTWKVHETCKTGEREAFPLNLYWIEKFDLKNPQRLAELKKWSETLIKPGQMDFAVQNIAQFFKRIGISFQPYNLRHAWAIRAHLLGIPIKAASDNLGHGVEIHTRTYQRYFGRDNRKKAINEAIHKKSEVELLKEKVAQLELENEKLKHEATSLMSGNSQMCY